MNFVQFKNSLREFPVFSIADKIMSRLKISMNSVITSKGILNFEWKMLVGSLSFICRKFLLLSAFSPGFPLTHNLNQINRLIPRIFDTHNTFCSNDGRLTLA